MMYPIIEKKPKRELRLNGINGGINLRDSLNMINDNQLTDGVNVWISDGILKTRPAAVTSGEMVANFGRVGGTQRQEGTRAYNDIKYTRTLKDGTVKEYVLVVSAAENDYRYETDGGESFRQHTKILGFYFQGTDDVISLPQLGIDYTEGEGEPTFFIFMKGFFLYCFTSNRNIYMLDLSKSGFIWSEPVSEDYYIPTVMTDCKAIVGSGENLSDRASVGTEGVAFEGYNLLCPYYKAVYSTVNRDLLDITDSTSSHQMTYFLPVLITDDLFGYKVKAKITDKNGIVTEHSLVLKDLKNDIFGKERTCRQDGLRMMINKYYLYFVDSNENMAEVTSADSISNNMVVTAPYKPSVTAQNKIFKMTECEWYGGMSNGINGGTRLFLGGNTENKNQSLLMWSGLNEPLYFSENSYSYVGNNTQKLTAFGKQNDMLVIFKEHETWFTQYTRNTDISADDLTSQNVIDYSASNVYFPLIQLHSAIGCDCPDTVQLCRNRLVWTTTSGKVYSLVTQSQYSERNIYEVGAMIERRLKGVDFKNIHSCDFGGYYILIAGTQMFLMDYNSSGYQYAYSYQKDEDANIRIPWYYFNFPYKNHSSFGCADVADRLMLFSVAGFGEGQPMYISYRLDGEDSADEYITEEPDLYSENKKINTARLPIESIIGTKLFEFSAEGYYKNIDLIRFSLANNGGAPIEVTLVTDCGEDFDEIVLEDEQTRPYSEGYISVVPIYPCIRSVLRFGIRLKCRGLLALDGFSIQFRVLGGAK